VSISLPFVSEFDLEIQKIVERFTPTSVGGIASLYIPYLNLNKPNYHDNKQEFLREQAAITSAKLAAETLMQELFGTGEDEEQANKMGETVRGIVDWETGRKIERRGVQNIHEFVAKTAADAGMSMVMLHQLIDIIHALEARLSDLADQEAEFWDVKHRPPNHHARIVALRLARLIAEHTGQKPTYGTSSQGGHPSTEYGRALEEVFEIIGIKAKVSRAAQWAINQIQDEDFGPKPNLMHNYLQNLSESPNDRTREILSSMMAKGLKK